MILYILLGVIVIFVIALVAGNKDAQKKGNNAIARFKQMEIKYEDYVKKNIQNHVLEKYDFQVDPVQLSKECLYIIKPDLDGLIALINSTSQSTIQLDFQANYFPNLVGLTEDYFRQSEKNQSKRLSPEEEENFRNTALDAILADIQKRLLDLKVGDF